VPRALAGGEALDAAEFASTNRRRVVVLLTPTELERLTIFTAAELARKRRARGLKLNHPEAVAIIVDEVMEKAREGKSVAELISYGSTILTTDDVMPGVADLMPFLQVEPVLKTGTKLVTIHEPIRAGKEKVDGVAPGEIATEDGEIEINAGRRTTKVTVVNTGDRPVQVGSHFHFFEANRELDFDREKTFGMHLDVPAGTAKRFAPGEHVEITLVEFGGTGEVWGLNNLTNGSVRSELTKKLALERAHQHGFKGA
jgi:urease subunit gamma/beta